MPDETAATIVDGWLHTGDLVTRQCRRHLHVRLAPQGGPAPARPEPVTRRGRGRDPGAPRRARGRRRGGSVGADRGRGQGLRRRRARAEHSDFDELAGMDGCSASRRSRSRGSGRLSTPCRVRRRRGSPSTSSRPATRPRSTTRRSLPSTAETEGPLMTRIPDLDRQLRRDVHPAAGTGSRGRPDGPGRLRRARLLAGRDAPAVAVASCGCSRPSSSRWPTTASRRRRSRRG